MKRRSALHDGLWQVAALGEPSDSLAVMACIDQFYVLGVHTQHPHEVAHAVKKFRNTPKASGSILNVEGLLLYDASSLLGEREPLRARMQAVALWISDMTWLPSVKARLCDPVFLSTGEAQQEDSDQHYLHPPLAAILTTERGFEFMRHVCQQRGQQMPSISSVVKMHKMHIRMRSQLLRGPCFSRCARVVARNDLDPVSKRCTLQALSCSRVQPFLTLHDFRLTLLEQAASHVMALKFFTHTRTFPSDVVDRIDEYGGFTGKLTTIRTIVAKAGVALAMLIVKVASQIKQHRKHIKRNTPAVVDTVESLLHQGAQREVCKEARPLTNILLQEANAASNDGFYMFMDWLQLNDSKQQNTTTCETTDVTQGETYDYVVLARPAAAARSDWLRHWQLRPPAEPLHLAYESMFFDTCAGSEEK